jgi:hypothetical protein
VWIEAVRRPVRFALDSMASVLLPSDFRISNQPLLFLNRIPGFNFAASFGAYDGALRRLVHLVRDEQLPLGVNLWGASLAEAIASRTILLNRCARALRRAGAKVRRVYRSTSKIVPGAMPKLKENAAVFAGAAAG